MDHWHNHWKWYHPYSNFNTIKVIKIICNYECFGWFWYLGSVRKFAFELFTGGKLENCRNFWRIHFEFNFSYVANWWFWLNFHFVLIFIMFCWVCDFIVGKSNYCVTNYVRFYEFFGFVLVLEWNSIQFSSENIAFLLEIDFLWKYDAF